MGKQSITEKITIRLNILNKYRNQANPLMKQSIDLQIQEYQNLLK